MKKLTIFLFSITSTLGCKIQTQNPPRVLIAGVGYDNIVVGKTTFKDVVDYYGADYKADTLYTHAPETEISSSDLDSVITVGVEIIHSIIVTYDSLGLQFSFHPKDNYILSVSVFSPFNAKTEKNIILGESTFKDIIKIYGDSPWVLGDSLRKCYDGICFYTPFDMSMYIDEEFKPYLDNKVTGISIRKFHDDK